MRPIYLLITTIVIALSAATSAMAQPPHRHHRNPCATHEQMHMVVQTLQEQSFDDKRLDIAKLCVTIGQFCTDDLVRMASTFNFDDNRLKFLRYAYPYCTDPERYPAVRECFEFRSNYDILMEEVYSAPHRR